MIILGKVRGTRMRVVTIEGIDGTGKTTLLNKLEDSIGEDLYCFVSFPTERFYKKYNELDKGKLQGDAYFKEVNRLQTEDKEYTYKLWKEKGKKVMFCDRFEVSQKVYDGSHLGEITSNIESDLVIYLMGEVENMVERIGERGVEDCLGYEELEELKRLAVRYERILFRQYEGRYKIVDAEQGKEGILQDTLEALKQTGYING